jgi:hypothetical protein
LAKTRKRKPGKGKPERRAAKKPAKTRTRKPATKAVKKPAKPAERKPKPAAKKPVIEAKEKFMSSFNIDSTTLLETDIDKLYDIIEEKGKVNLAEVAKALSSPLEKVRDWADILEEHDMIDIDYPVVGSPVLKKKVVRDKASREIEKKIMEVDKHHKKLSKAPFIPLGIIGGAGLVLYMTSLQYTVVDQVMTLINQNPQMSDFINTLPFREALFQNLIHILFGAFALLVVLVFVIFKFVRKK